MYNPSELDRSDGDDVVEFAAAERLSHLRAACNGGVPLPEPTQEQPQQRQPKKKKKGKQHGGGGGGGAAAVAAGEGDSAKEAIAAADASETIRALRSPYVVGMLAAGKDWLPEARASLSRWSDDVSAPLAYSRALLAFVDWRNSMPTDDDDDDDGEGGEAYTDPFGGGSDGDDDDGSGNDSDAIDDINGEAAPELVPAFAEGGVGEADGKEADKEAVGEQDSDAEATTGDAGEEDDEFNTPEAVAAAEAMADVRIRSIVISFLKKKKKRVERHWGGGVQRHWGGGVFPHEERCSNPNHCPPWRLCSVFYPPCAPVLC